MEKYLDLIQNKSRWVYAQNAAFNKSLNIKIEDCDAAAAVGFHRAMMNFNPKKGSAIGKYAVNYIRQEVRNEINKLYGHRKKRASYEFIDSADRGGGFPVRANSMSFLSILNTFRHKLTDYEAELLQLRYCDDISAFKIAKRQGKELKVVEKSLRAVGKKLKKEILKYGKVRRKPGVSMDDVESNMIKAHAEYLKNKFIEKEERVRIDDY